MSISQKELLGEHPIQLVCRWALDKAMAWHEPEQRKERLRNAIASQFTPAEWQWLCAKAPFKALIRALNTPDDIIVAVLVGRTLLPVRPVTRGPERRDVRRNF
jgi:hypothetical protein